MLEARVPVLPAAEAPTAVRAWPGPKPRLAFFRPSRQGLAGFVEAHLAEHLRCLEQFFDVTLITGDADYREVCDRVEPDLALFESGVYARRRRRYTRTDAHPEIPKAGLLNADAYCVSRSVYLADMHEWGVETFFSISPVMAAHTPDIADRLYTWPNFADRSVFHDYGTPERTPILLSGSRQAHYPWRLAVDEALREAFDVAVQPHHGWFDRAAAAAMPVGEAYARQLAGALIAPACGTIAAEVVRKHFEIPAAGAVLVAPASRALELAGFEDGVTCVFAEPSDVVEKVGALLADPEARERIARAGQALVHERHDITARDQVRAWFELSRRAGAHEIVVQDHPFAPMRLADRGAGDEPWPMIALPAPDLELRAAAERDLRAGRADAAAEGFEGLLALQYVPEAVLGLARARLAQGRVDVARELVVELVARSVRDRGAPTPDPVEWAFYLRVLLCAGEVRRAAARARAYPGLVHPELDRMRALVGVVAGTRVAAPVGRVRRSVHVCARSTWPEVLAALSGDLRACGRDGLAARLTGASEPAAPGGVARQRMLRRRTPREFRRPLWPTALAAVRRRIPSRGGSAR